MYKCIICDDEKLTRDGLTELIKMVNEDLQVVSTASTGDEAIQRITTLQPEIVLMDINMPSKDGLEVIETVRELEIPIKFIIISGYSSFEYAQKAIRLGVVDYLLKPITKKTLTIALERCISQISSNRTDSAIIVPEHVDQNLVSRLLNYIEEHYTEQEFSLEILAEQFNFSPSYVSKMIKKETQQSFTEILNTRRIELAKHLLMSNKDLLINDISDRCGYSSQHYFSRIFKNTVGVTPVDFRNQ